MELFGWSTKELNKQKEKAFRDGINLVSGWCEKHKKPILGGGGLNAQCPDCWSEKMVATLI